MFLHFKWFLRPNDQHNFCVNGYKPMTWKYINFRVVVLENDIIFQVSCSSIMAELGRELFGCVWRNGRWCYWNFFGEKRHKNCICKMRDLMLGCSEEMEVEKKSCVWIYLAWFMVCCLPSIKGFGKKKVAMLYGANSWVKYCIA